MFNQNFMQFPSEYRIQKHFCFIPQNYTNMSTHVLFWSLQTDPHLLYLMLLYKDPYLGEFSLYDMLYAWKN